MSSLATILRAVVSAPTANDAVAANVLQACSNLDAADITEIRLAVAENTQMSAAFAATLMNDDDVSTRLACYARDDIDQDMVIAAVASEPELWTLPALAESKRPAILSAVVSRLTQATKPRSATHAEFDQTLKTLTALSNNDDLAPTDAATLVTWLTYCGRKIVGEGDDLQRAYSRLAYKAFTADHTYAAQLLSLATDLDLVFVLWCVANQLPASITDLGFERTIMQPLKTVAGVPDVIHGRLYRISSYMTAEQDTALAALLTNRDLTDCTRAEWLRTRYLTTDDERDEQAITARTSRDPFVLTRMFQAELDMSSTLAYTLATNPACPLPLALDCFRHLAVGHATQAVRAFADDDDRVVAMLVRWPGLICELSDERRPPAAFAALMALPLPWGQDQVRFAETFIEEITEEDLDRLPLDAIARLIGKSDKVAAWAVGTIGRLDSLTLTLLARLGNRGDVPLGKLCEVAAAV